MTLKKSPPPHRNQLHHQLQRQKLLPMHHSRDHAIWKQICSYCSRNVWIQVHRWRANWPIAIRRAANGHSVFKKFRTAIWFCWSLTRSAHAVQSNWILDHRKQWTPGQQVCILKWHHHTRVWNFSLIMKFSIWCRKLQPSTDVERSFATQACSQVHQLSSRGDWNSTVWRRVVCVQRVTSIAECYHYASGVDTNSVICIYLIMFKHSIRRRRENRTSVSKALSNHTQTHSSSRGCGRRKNVE